VAGGPDLEELVANELSRPAPESARRLADEIRRRHGTAVAAVVFYGSCLRKRTHDGVLDFYVLVDSYREAYRSRVLTWANALLPPNVFYLEIESPLGTLRSKYAVVSTRDFESATAPTALRPGIWARFCQPAALVYARDEAARQTCVGAAAASVITALQQGLPLLPAEGETLRFRFDEFWQHTLRETYAAEMRPEAAETIRSVYLAGPERFDRAARIGLDALAERGWLRWRDEGDLAVATLPAARRRRAARGWKLRKPLRKTLYMISLLKSTATFGDWLPYVLWKLERHGGTRIELTDRQRRHPLIWGWPVLWRVLRRRDLR
jgi:hypothetical protein